MIKLNGVEVASSFFSDKTQKIKTLPESEIEGKELKITWLYNDDTEVFKICCLAMHLKEKGAAHITLEVPYVPNGRMDRTEEDGDVFTLKYFGKFIGSLHFDRIEVFDAHSRVTMACLDNVHEKSPIEIIKSIIDQLNQDQNLVLYYPDRGAKNRYQDKFIGMNYLFGEKRRDWETSEITHLVVNGRTEFIKGAKILMIDDICSSGNTLRLSAIALKDLGAADIYVYVSHCENGVPNSELVKSGLITGFYTTNSLFNSASCGEDAVVTESGNETVVKLPTTTFHILDLF